MERSGSFFFKSNCPYYSSLNILAMGGNDLREVPTIVGELKTLQALILCDNKIESLPSTIANLKQLKSLQLHKNCLRTLPPAIIKLEHLTEVSSTYLGKITDF